MTQQNIDQQCCKHLIIIIDKYETTFIITTLFNYNKVKQYRKITCTIEKKLKLGGIATFPLKSQGGWKFEKKAIES